MKKTVKRVTATVVATALVMATFYYCCTSGVIDSYVQKKEADPAAPSWSFGQQWYSPQLVSNEKRIFSASQFKLDNKKTVTLAINQYPASADLQNEDVSVFYWIVDEYGQEKTVKKEMHGHFRGNDNAATLVFEDVEPGSYRVAAQTIGALDSLGSGNVSFN